MRALPLALSCCMLLLGFAAAGDLKAQDTETGPGLTVFSDDRSDETDTRPTVLRGEATRRGTVEGDSEGRFYEQTGLQIGAGAKLWLADPVTGRVIVCDERRTSRVGGRYIGCLEDRLPFTVYE